MIFDEIAKDLRKNGIVKHNFDELNSKFRQYATQYFYENIAPLLSPQIIDSYHPFPHLANKKLYIYCILERDEKKKKNSKEYIGLIPIPYSLPNYIKFPDTNEFILMEDLVYAFVEGIFTNYRVKYKTVAAVTRNADINLQETPIDEDEDYRHFMKNILKKRKRLSPIRLEFYKSNDHNYTKYLRKELGLHKNQDFHKQSPIKHDFIHEFIKEIPDDVTEDLTFPEFIPQRTSQIDPNKSLFKQLDKKDILLFYPYQTMNHFLDFLKEAANDPEVLSIKITLYRVARTSSVIKYLLEALDNDKEVTVLIELRARFDEKNNIHYAELLEEAGCQILY